MFVGPTAAPCEWSGDPVRRFLVLFGALLMPMRAAGCSSSGFACRCCHKVQGLRGELVGDLFGNPFGMGIPEFQKMAEEMNCVLV